MKCRFYLLDINEGRWDSKPSVQLWGLDQKNRRVVIVATQIAPYFYFLPDEKDDPAPIREKLLSDKSTFPKILSADIETKKLLGRLRTVLRITCSDSEVVSDYAKKTRKAVGRGESFEDDLRLSLRYIIDLMLTPCGWHELDVEIKKFDGVNVDQAYEAKTAPRSVEDEDTPDLRILAFNVLAVAERGSAKAERDPVKAVVAATDSGRMRTFVAESENDSKVLEDFAGFVIEYDPDIVVGFENNKVDWPYLIQRGKARKVRLAVGRDGSDPHTSMFGHVSVTGRANLDLFDVAGGIPEIKVKTIANMARYLQVPSAEKISTIEEADRYNLWIDESGRSKLIQYLRANAQVLLELAQATIQYPMQLGAVTGLPLDQVMAAAVGFRVDCYLVRKAHQIGELIPRRNEQPFYTYRGAIVLEPQTGVHDDIAVLDFSSMYPNLMMKYNLSPDTLVKEDEKVSKESVFVITEVEHRFRKEPAGFYRIVLSELMDQRAIVQKELEEIGAKSTRYRVLKERERAIKIITNACYGYAGWAGARWYVREVAESATALGREAITKTIQKAEWMGLKIIYGDTDSIFVRNEEKKIDQLRKWAMKELGLEIRIAHEYRRVIFTEAMKRYAGLLPDGRLDIVGLEVVRGDWSEIARQVQEQVLVSILRDQSVDKAITNVRETIRRLRNNEVAIADLTIRKTLLKPIEEYRISAPHVEVAKKLLKQGWDLGVGDVVGYVIVKGAGKLFQKARPYNQVKPEDVDVEYYLENQVKPAAMRILERFAVSEKQLEVNFPAGQQPLGVS